MPFQKPADIWMSDTDIRNRNAEESAETAAKAAKSPFVFPYETYRYKEGDEYDVVGREIIAKAIDLTAVTERPIDDATDIRSAMLGFLFESWPRKDMQIEMTRLQRLALFPWAGLWKDVEEFRWDSPDRLAELADGLHVARAYELAKKRFMGEWITSSVFHRLPDIDVTSPEETERAIRARGYLIKGCAQHLEIRRTYYDGERLEELLKAAEVLRQVTYGPWWIMMRGNHPKYPDYRAFQLFDICGMAEFSKNIVVAKMEGPGWSADGKCGICRSPFVKHGVTALPDYKKCDRESCGRMVMVVEHA